MARLRPGPSLSDVVVIMAPASVAPDERARKMTSAILQRLSPPGTQAAMATALGVSEATISRRKEDIEQNCQLLAHLGLKVVDEGRTCVPPAELDFLRSVYRRVSDQAPWLLSEDES
jgi:hypothetical protein